MRYVHIENGTREVRDLVVAEESDLLPALDSLVGGYLEAFLYADGEVPGTKLVALCNEDGIRLRLPINVHSARGVIVGPVVVFGLTTHGETRGLTESEIERVVVFEPPRSGGIPTFVLSPYALRLIGL